MPRAVFAAASERSSDFGEGYTVNRTTTLTMTSLAPMSLLIVLPVTRCARAAGTAATQMVARRYRQAAHRGHLASEKQSSPAYLSGRVGRMR